MGQKEGGTMDEEKIKTRAPRESGEDEIIVTGNEFLALPCLSENGRIENLNLLSEEARGLLEFQPEKGKSFLVPFCRLEDEVLEPQKWTWKQLDYWIPVVEIICAGGKMDITYLFPPEERGGVIVITYKNEGLFAQNISLGLEGSWRGCTHSIYRARNIEGQRQILRDDWTQTMNLEFYSGLPRGALALKGGRERDQVQVGKGEKKRNLGPGKKIGVKQGKLEFSLEREFQVEAGEKVTWPVYIAAGIEPDAAATTCIHLQRKGWPGMLAESRKWLQARAIDCQPSDLARKVNYNLFFNFFFSSGRSIEKGKLHLLTSRSPRYYVSGAYWPRDALLWSLPGIMELDKERARDLLQTAISRHWSAGGTHSQYITGGELYPGFEVDQLCSYFIALERFWNWPGGKKMVAKMPLNQMARDFFRWLYAWKHQDKFLFATFLDPSDDPPSYPYVTYNQVLIWRVLGFFIQLAEKELLGLPLSWLKRLREGIAFEVKEQAVVELGDGRQVLAGTFDGQGNYELYENPPGPLALLPYWGFISREDPLYRNTMGWAHSSENPYFLEEGKYSGLASAHADGAWVLEVIGQLLAGYKTQQNLSWLKNAPMDGQLACETVDPGTGKACTGLAFATCAGFLGYALARALRKENNAEF